MITKRHKPLKSEIIESFINIRAVLKCNLLAIYLMLKNSEWYEKYIGGL